MLNNLGNEHSGLQPCKIRVCAEASGGTWMQSDVAEQEDLLTLAVRIASLAKAYDKVASDDDAMDAAAVLFQDILQVLHCSTAVLIHELKHDLCMYGPPLVRELPTACSSATKGFNIFTQSKLQRAPSGT